MFAHGYGCDQAMWRYRGAAFADDYRIVLFDHVGAGGPTSRPTTARVYGSLQGTPTMCSRSVVTRARRRVFVGHSVSAMIGVLAAIKEPGRFGQLVPIGPSPRYIDDAGYVGGFSALGHRRAAGVAGEQLPRLARAMAPVIMGNPDRPELAEELTDSFCRTDPDDGQAFARVTFLSDNRPTCRR